MSFMRTNPFTTPVGQRIERATNESQASEDWGLIMEITDIINETEEGAKDAVKALKKRLFGNKKWKEVIFSLTILETCVKNCQHRFHVLVCKQEFCKELVKVIQPNLNPPTIVQEKILSLIQSWADAFKNDPTLHGVVKVYEELKSKSIEFPPTDLDALSPIRTPQRATPEVDPAMNRPAPTRQATQPRPAPTQQTPPPQQQQQQAATGAFTAEHMAKLRRELDLVLGNVRVMSEMLTEMQPGQENPDDLELLQELNQTCRTMQKRVVQLLSEVTHEEVTGELLRVNDDLNNMFVRYDRYERYRQSQAQATQPTQAPPTMPATTAMPPAMPAIVPAAAPITAQAPGQGESNVGTLIDLGLDDPAPAPAPAYPAAPAPGYPAAPAPGYPAAPAPGYPAAPAPGYPAAPAGAGMSGPPVGAYDGLPYPEVTGQVPGGQAPGAGPLTDQLAGLSMTGGSVSNTLGQISNVPTSANPPPADDDFDMFAQSRGTSYQDSIRSGSTYQDNTNLDQGGGALAGYVQNRSFPPPAQQPTAAPAATTTRTGGGMDEMEQWLTASDLNKPADNYAAANTNSDVALGDQGISSSEFDKFLQDRAKAGETLPTANIGGHSNVMAPASTQQNRQMQLNETENSMFAL